MSHPANLNLNVTIEYFCNPISVGTTIGAVSWRLTAPAFIRSACCGWFGRLGTCNPLVHFCLFDLLFVFFQFFLVVARQARELGDDLRNSGLSLSAVFSSPFPPARFSGSTFVNPRGNGFPKFPHSLYRIPDNKFFQPRVFPQGFPRARASDNAVHTRFRNGISEYPSKRFSNSV